MVDIYYLYKIYSKTDEFICLKIDPKSEYLNTFLKFHQKEIDKISPNFKFDALKHNFAYYVLRNAQISGIFLAHKINDKTLAIDIEYAIPEYRDYKNGKFLYESLKNEFIKAGYTKLIANQNDKAYYKKINFDQDNEGNYYKSLV